MCVQVLCEFPRREALDEELKTLVSDRMLESGRTLPSSVCLCLQKPHFVSNDFLVIYSKHFFSTQFFPKRLLQNGELMKPSLK